LIDDLAQDSVLTDEILEFLVEGLAERAELTPEIAERALARWSQSAPGFDGIFQAAASKVQASETEPKLALFESMLRAPGPSFTLATHQALGRMHLRAHLPLLERSLGGEFASNETLRSDQQARSAEALACYLDDEAAQILLRGVGRTTDASVRDACFAALETIRRYQDERARWNSRADAGRARAETIAELVGLIEAGDAAQRVEAVRALGTLEALEELPRLVRLAGSKDAALAKAAREALERIHAAGRQD
jgi:HEAT repeat protein